MDALAIPNPETRLAIAYAPLPARAGLEALFALDARLGGIVARATEPTIGLMRLVWWRDALEALYERPPPAEPLLVACAKAGLPGVALASMSEGWEVLLDDPALSDETIERYATARGARLFELAGRLLGAEDARLARAGAGWARIDLSRHLDRPDRMAAIVGAARMPLAEANRGRWPRPLRPLGQLAMLAGRDAGASALAPLASRRRLLRIAGFHLTGR